MGKWRTREDRSKALKAITLFYSTSGLFPEKGIKHLSIEKGLLCFDLFFDFDNHVRRDFQKMGRFQLE